MPGRAARLTRIFTIAAGLACSAAFVGAGAFFVAKVQCGHNHEFAKKSEAKNGIGAIARAAVRAFDETGSLPGRSRALCASATPVPRVIPRERKAQPSETEGDDFHTGTDTAGWRCLRFTITNPVYYRYDYRAGAGYLGPARGGIDPGPDGFEASAEGDLDGDGKTSLFVVTGRIDRAKNEIVMDEPRYFDEDE